MGVRSSSCAAERPMTAGASCSFWLLISLFSGGLLAGCGVPEHMQVGRATHPQSVDKDVRFRTTYYYRVFDYCWNKNTGEQQIIPETDTLYRYRMTGKAHSLFSQVKFESGVLPAKMIDPFGTDVVYDRDIGGFRVRDQAQAEQEAQRIRNAAEQGANRQALAANKEAAWQRYLHLRAAYEQLPALPATATDEQKATAQRVRTDLETAMAQALATYTSDLAVALPPADRAALDELTAKIDASLGQPRDEGTREELAKVRQTLAQLVELSEGATPLDAACPRDALVRRRGFQIMGPEGWKTFDQDERLLMAMSTRAKPLIETLQEYSGRVLNSRVNPADALLPLVRENLVTVQAQQAAERADPSTAAVDQIFGGALTAFGGN